MFVYICLYQYIAKLILGVKCGPLTVSNGKVEGKDFSFGNKVTISCLKGYFLTSGDKERTCQANKTWSGAETVCKCKYHVSHKYYIIVHDMNFV